MNREKKWRLRVLAGLQVFAAAAIAGAILYLLYRYVQYGERFARETGARRQTENLWTADSEKTDFGPAVSEAAESETADSKITAAEENTEKSIRVRLLTDDFLGEYHEEVILTCEKSFDVKLDGKRIRKGKTYRVRASELKKGQALQAARKDGGPITVESLNRADGHPQYAGILRMYRGDGGIVLVNELPLEEYLCGVVASEMPSDYPEEALKAQAVCARTYACCCIQNAGNEDADLDDSVSYQVYNNYQATDQSRRAVEATAGETLPLDEIQYYSTSCQSEHREDLDSDKAFRGFLSQEPDAGEEFDSPWLRWETEISARDILQELVSGYGWQADRIDEIRTVRRAGNGQVLELEVRGGDETERIKGEYAVRQVLSPGQTILRLRDGEEHSGMRLLPSAFFWMEMVRQQDPKDGVSGKDGEEAKPPIDKVALHGGGYGHGIGMSQCGAAALAEKGLDYREILEYYYSVGINSR